MEAGAELGDTQDLPTPKRRTLPPPPAPRLTMPSYLFIPTEPYLMAHFPDSHSLHL